MSKHFGMANTKFKYGGSFLQQLGDIGVISVRYQLSLCCVLGSLFLRLHLAVSCLFGW